MTLRTKRLGSTSAEPHTLEVQPYLAGASTLLWHVARLPGVHVLAKKSFAMTDDFEAYFSYKQRLWVMETPFAKINVCLLAQPADEQLFREVESWVQRYPHALSLLLPVAWLRYSVLAFTPPRAVFQSFGVPYPGELSQHAP